MSLAPQELENSASKFAAEAIKLDSQGARGMAISNYQRAIESLVKLIQLYPDNKLNKVNINNNNIGLQLRLISFAMFLLTSSDRDIEVI